MSDPRNYGRRGETFAAAVYSRAGYAVLARNYHSRFGELDLIVEKDGIRVFVEVKTRSSDRFGSPGEAVDERKRRRMWLTILRYLSETGYDGACHAEVFELYVEHDRPARYRVIECPPTEMNEDWMP